MIEISKNFNQYHLTKTENGKKEVFKFGSWDSLQQWMNIKLTPEKIAELKAKTPDEVWNNDDDDIQENEPRRIKLIRQKKAKADKEKGEEDEMH